MKEYTIIYKIEATEILTEEEMELLPKKSDGSIDEQGVAKVVREMLDVDDAVITEAKIFEGGI